MASNVSHQLTVATGAALSGSFRSVTSDATSRISKIGTAIKDMEKQSVLSVGTIDRLKSRYNSFLGSMDKQQTIIQKRAFYRSQIMDVIALGTALAAPIKMAKEFNSHLSKFKRMYDFKESDGHRKLVDVLTGISLQVPVTIDTISDSSFYVCDFSCVSKDFVFRLNARERKRKSCSKHSSRY